MSFELQILGTSAAIQANGKHQSAQILKIQNHTFLIDCGEGTQDQIKRRKINSSKIEKIFISHLHGDHFLGLFGFLSTMSLLGRTKKIEIFGPKGLKEIIITQLKYSQSYFSYPVDFYETQCKSLEKISENDALEIFCFPLEHGIDCTGFLFKEKEKALRLDHEKIPKEIAPSLYKELKKGNNLILSDGEILQAKDCTFPPKKRRTYAYCSDTCYSKETSTYVKEVDLLYHESTFLVKHQDKAKNTMHSSTYDAALVAKESNVGKLLLGHFSARYTDDDEFETEARSIFENSFAAREGFKYTISDEV